MGLFDDFFNIFKDKDDRRNNTASDNELVDMKDTHVSFGEDPGTIGNPKDEEE